MIQNVVVASRNLNSGKKNLLLSCAVAAMAAGALHPQQARADAFVGSMTGGATRTSTGATTETITVNSQNTILDWTPNNGGTGNIVFLPTGNEATFQGGTGLTDYTVLNRVVPTDATRKIELNGTVKSFVDGGAKGGSVWFYSPGGIVVGSSAVFDVGALLLTSMEVSNLSGQSDNFTASFAPAEGVTPGPIQISSGAQIDALQQNSYVALVAPRIEQGGSVQVKGSAAYVAAESLTMTMNQGLFDVQVDIGGGTTDSEGVVHTGSTTWPVDTTGTPRIYMVAVPKNQALEMLLGGTAGFASAGAAAFDNGAIVLSAGGSVKEIGQGFRSYSAPSGTDASLTIDPGTYRAHVDSMVNGNIEALADTGSILFGGNLTLRSQNAAANGNITLGSSSGNAFNVAGDFTASTIGSQFTSLIQIGADSGGTITFDKTAFIVGGAAQDGTLADVNIYATGTGSQLTVTEGTQIFANASASSNPSPLIEGRDNYGGNVGINATSGGEVHLADLSIDVSAKGEMSVAYSTSIAGDGQGGNVNIQSSSDGVIDVGGDLYVDVSGLGGDVGMTDGITPSVGGQGKGGSISVNSYDGTITVGGNTRLRSLGIGGSFIGEGFSPVTGGRGEGGFIETFLGGPGTITYVGNVTLEASGTGGDAVTGGDGQGGSAGFTAQDGTMNIGPSVTIEAMGRGGNADTAFGGQGGRGDGGVGYVEARARLADSQEIIVEATSTINGGDVTIDAGGIGGKGGASNGDNSPGGAGGIGAGGLYEGVLGTGGAFAASEYGSEIHLGNVTLKAQGTGGQGGAGAGLQGGGAGGAAFGGSTTIGTYGPEGIGSTATFGAVSLDVTARGGDGGLGGTGQGAGGAATGGGYDDPQTPGNDMWGGSRIDTFGDVTMDSAILIAQAIGGAGSVGGQALGGSVQAVSWADSSSDLTINGNLQLNSYAEGGAGGTGGNAVGGYAGFGALETAGSLDPASVKVTGQVGINTDGHGGAGGATGGSGKGGVAEILIDSGSMDVGGIFATAQGRGGIAPDTSAAGTGGETTLTISAAGGSLESGGDVVLNAVGFGGAGQNNLAGAGGNGGVGTGGTSAFDILATSATADIGGSLVLDARGVGGDGGQGSTDGGAGGNGQGGVGSMTIDGDVKVTVDAVINVNSRGGNGGVGISGAGGAGGAGLTGNTDALTLNGKLQANGYFGLARAFGGAGGDGFTIDGAGGDAFAGTSTIDIVGQFIATGLVDTDGAYIFGASSTAFGGAGSSGGDAWGGSTTATISGQANGNLNVVASGLAGDANAGAGGDGFGGNASVTVSGTMSADGGFAIVHANGEGGDGTTAGGNAQAGFASLTVENGGLATIVAATAPNDNSIRADATGGNASAGTGGSASAIESTARVNVDAGGQLTSGGMIVSSSSTGGNGSAGGGDATAGSAEINVDGSASLGDTTVLAQGFGGAGSSGGGGNAQAGSAVLRIAGSATGGNIFVQANAVGGSGADDGGSAQGGDATVDVTGSATLATLQIRGSAQGGASTTAVGGNGQSGDAFVDVDGGTLDVTGLALVLANGNGGNGAGGGGYGTGGTADATADNGGSITFGGANSTINASGNGGDSSGGTAGNGTGGTGSANAFNGSTLAGNFIVGAQSSGGDGLQGGSAQGGRASLVASGTGSTLNLTKAWVSSQAIGGAGTTSGGNAIGGTTQVVVEFGASGSTSSTTIVDAQAYAGAATAGIGGNATGGDLSISIEPGSTATFANLDASVDAQGGSGVDGGNGQGGFVDVRVDGGALALTGVNRIHSDGYGGSATTGIGGTGTGGTSDTPSGAGAQLLAINGSTLSGSWIEVTANGSGGNSTGGQGGIGQAGFALIETQVPFGAANVIVSGDGEGGDGASGGGDGFGGDAAVRLAGDSNIMGLSITARGTGGDSGNGTGGDGTGGYARTTAYNGATATANNVTVDTSGVGGDGVNGGNGTGGQNVAGAGGSVIQSFNGSYTLTGTTTVLSNGVGGDATGPSGVGGAGTGGDAGINAISGPVSFAGSIDANGTGGAGAGAAGAGTGGDIQLQADAAAMTGGMIALHANGSADGGAVSLTTMNGGSITLASVNATANGANGSAGDVLVDVDGTSSMDLGIAALTANGTALPGSGEDGVELSILGNFTADQLDLTSSDGILLETLSGGQIGSGALIANSLSVVRMVGDGSATLISSNVLDLTGSDIQFGTNVDANDILLTLPGDYAIGSLPFANNSLTINAGGDISAAETIFYSAALALNADGGITTGDISVFDSSLALNAVGDITTGDLTAGLGIAAQAGGNLTVGDVISGFVPVGFVVGAAVPTGEDVTLISDGDLSTRSITSAGGITLQAGGSITSSGDYDAANDVTATAGTFISSLSALAGGDIGLVSGTDLSALNLDAGGAITAAASGGLQVADATANGGIALSGAGITTGDLSSGSDVTVTANGSFSVGDVNATTQADFIAGGLASFEGVVSAPTINVTSGDIAIVDGAGLGEQGVTNVINLLAVSDEPVLIGSGLDAAEGQYTLDEDGDISADTVNVTAQSASAGSDPDVILGSLEIEGSDTDGGGVSHVNLTTGGNIFVNGIVDFTDAGAADTLSLNAGDSIQVNTDAGGIAMTDTGGNVAGSLSLTAHDVWVASGALLDQINGTTDLGSLADELAVNTGAVVADGYLRAGGITVTMLGSSFLVQNSGTADAPAGVTVGQGGLTIVNEGADPATVILFGQQQNGDGTVTSGDAFFDTVDFSGAGGFDDSSTINGCDFGNGCAPDVPDVPEAVGGVESILGPIGLMDSPMGFGSTDDEFGGTDQGSDDEDDGEDDGEEDDGSSVDPSVRLINTGPVSIDQPIDEPVTSGSDAPGGGDF